jgi:methionine-rich copper-binding protein CopC
VIASGSLSRVRRTSVAVLTAITLALGTVLATALPASAHDDLLSSTPESGATVDVLPAQLVLTFSAELLSDGSSTVVEVTDAAGTAVTDAAPVVDGSTVTQSLAGTSTGAIRVLWRVVSSDGHPISGELGFEVAATPAPAETTPAASPTASATSEPLATASPEPTVTTVAAPAESSGADPLPWILGGLGLLVVIGLVVWLLAARARQQKEVARERIAGRDVPGER